MAATEAADESAQSALAAFTLPAVIKDAGESTAAVGDDDTAGMDLAAGLLALAQKLHNEYVAEGRKTREKLISEGQLRHDQVQGARRFGTLNIGGSTATVVCTVTEAE